MGRHLVIAAEILRSQGGSAKKPIRDPDSGVVHYYMIGHLLDPNQSAFLWNWTGSKIETSELNQEETDRISHGDLFGPTGNRYQGRFDPHNKHVSISVPSSQRHRDVPSALITALEKKFSPKKIYVFH